MPQKARSCRKGLSRDAFENVFVRVDAKGARFRNQFGGSGTKCAPEKLGFHGPAHELTLSGPISFRGLCQLSSHLPRETDGEGFSHSLYDSAVQN